MVAVARDDEGDQESGIGNAGHFFAKSLRMDRFSSRATAPARRMNGRWWGAVAHDLETACLVATTGLHLHHE